MSRADIRLLRPPRARWGQYWDPRTGAFVWGCIGPGCQVQTTMLAGTPGAYWSGGACYGAACPPEQGLGQGCPPCHITTGDRCVPCPEGADFPECEGCEGGVPREGKVPWYDRPLAGPVIIGLVSAVTIGIAIPVMRKHLSRRGIALE